MTAEGIQTEAAKHVDQGVVSLISTDARSPFEWFSAEYLAANPVMTEFVIDDVLVKGAPCLIAGPSKSLKTGMSLDMAVSLAAQRPFLNRFDVFGDHRVLFMSAESGRATITRKFLTIAEAKGLSTADLEPLRFCFDVPDLTSDFEMDWIHKDVEKHRADVLFIDPAYMAMNVQDGATSLFKMGAVLKELSKLAQKTGCTPVLLHHFSGKEQIGRASLPTLDSVAFAGFREWARQWMLIQRLKHFVPEELSSHDLILSFGGSDGHHSVVETSIGEGDLKNLPVWEVETFPFKGREKAAQGKKVGTIEKHVVKILAALETFEEKGLVGKTKLREKAGLNPKDFEAAASLLESRGQLLVHRTRPTRPTYGPVKVAP